MSMTDLEPFRLRPSTNASAALVACAMLWGCRPPVGSTAGGGYEATQGTAIERPTPKHQVKDGTFCLESPDGVELGKPPGFFLTPNLPADVYPYLRKGTFKDPDTQSELLMLQAWHHVYSWQLFTALNWPVDATAAPRATLSELGAPRWTTWRDNYELYTADASDEPAWDKPRILRQPQVPAPPVELLPRAVMADRTVRLLYDTSQAGVHEVLWDQNGAPVYYETLLNDEVFALTLDFGLHTVEGQRAYYEEYEHDPVDFTYGSCTERSRLGSMALKFAWKVLGQNDHPERYLAMEARVPSLAGAGWETKRVGLVGMHVAHKTLKSNKRWIWTTFEHVDNLRVDDADVMRYEQVGKPLAASFTNPGCPTCPVNVPPEPSADGKRRTQVHRLLPIPQNLERLNDSVRDVLRRAAPQSPLQYYELIGTQFTTIADVAAAAPSAGPPASIVDKGGGRPFPTFLVNTVLETYSQRGNQRLEDVVPGSAAELREQTVFATQSCLGCHVDASIQIKDEQGNFVEGRGLGDYHFQFKSAR